MVMVLTVMGIAMRMRMGSAELNWMEWSWMEWSWVELSSVEFDAYLTAPRPWGNNGIACQRNGTRSHTLSALFACQLLQLRVGALALVERNMLQVVYTGRWIINRLVLEWIWTDQETTR